jgi:hypothetical protein
MHMLSEMAWALHYPKLQQIDIDKFYSPTIYAQQAEVNAQMQTDIMSFFRSSMSLISQKQGESTNLLGLDISILSPEEGSHVAQKQDVRGYVYPPAAKVQILVFAPGNGFWYPQGPIHRDGAKWTVIATIGDEHSAGQSFKLVAIVTATKITQRIKELPLDARMSRIVIVTRIGSILNRHQSVLIRANFEGLGETSFSRAASAW